MSTPAEQLASKSNHKLKTTQVRLRLVYVD